MFQPIVKTSDSERAAVNENALDLVCTAPDKGMRLRVEYIRSSAVFLLSIIGAGFSAGLVFTLVAAFPGFGCQLGLIVLVLVLCCLYVFANFQCSFPTNIQCNPSALLLAWKSNTQKQSVPIRWDSIIGTSILNQGQKEIFPYIVLNIDLAAYSFLERLILMYQTMSLWTNWYPCRQYGASLDVLSVAFPLHSLTLETDKMRLLSFIKSKIDASLLSDNLLTMAESKGTPTYTQLWLDDMQSFRRSRTGALEPDTVLHEDRYLITGLLATGGQARIYRGLDKFTEQPVVLKEFVLPTNAGADVRNNSFASIKNEASFLSSLNHPGIVKLQDHFVEDHRAYLVLEFIEGNTLRNLVKANGPLSEELVVKICRSLCEICSYLHEQIPSVVHRDLTPDNMILTDDGELRLIDFSVAQHFEADRTKTVSGKHNYMAPEQFRGSPTTQSDLYALGGTLYYLLTGTDPTPLSCSVVPEHFNVTEKMRNLISQLTKMDLSARYKSAADVVRDLP